MLTRIRKDVSDATGKAQRPWTSSSLQGDVFLIDGKPNAAAHP